MIKEKIPQLRTLSPEEKLILVAELWDELAANAELLPTRKDHIAILRDRLEQHRQHPDDVVSWEDVKARILAEM